MFHMIKQRRAFLPITISNNQKRLSKIHQGQSLPKRLPVGGDPALNARIDFPLIHFRFFRPFLSRPHKSRRRVSALACFNHEFFFRVCIIKPFTGVSRGKNCLNALRFRPFEVISSLTPRHNGAPLRGWGQGPAPPFSGKSTRDTVLTSSWRAALIFVSLAFAESLCIATTRIKENPPRLASALPFSTHMQTRTLGFSLAGGGD